MDPENQSKLEELGLTENQIRGVNTFWRGLAEEWEYKEIAEEIGVSPKTLWKWRQQDKFWDAFKLLYDESMLELLPKVVTNFNRVLDKDNSTSVEVAKQILRATGLADREDNRGDNIEPLQVVCPGQEDSNGSAD